MYKRSKAARIPLTRGFLSVFFLTVGFFHLKRNLVLLRKEGNNNFSSIDPYNAIDPPYTTTPFLRNVETNLAKAKNTLKSFGEQKKLRIQSHGGISSRGLAWDRNWIEDVSNKIGCPDVDSDGIHADDPKGYTNIPTAETWNALYRAYHATVDPNNVLMPATEYQNSWKVPIEVKFRRPEGRGVYAKEFIPKGTIVWSSTSRNTATFLSPRDRREFIKYLMNDPQTRHLACDVRNWVDVVRPPNMETFVICETFDEAVLLNTAWDENEGEEINLDTKSFSLSADDPDLDESDCYENDHYFAIRDIQAGEQLRIEYTSQ
ncbi:SET methyltransferase domain containing protein [Nitzschia inconspicua]|uniref:SET methyltransferase domain containing protein n=1 Tax=Nitzschia inconspicua TaxID=303405 RepID=A0A9K3M4F7_9STRA|nr:SET methyltransferase domain containing protein [Nitzschia inconspicua]KAG7373533.1 SET methyltransferase domain containing protein [Nitzschia inconspicua]